MLGWAARRSIEMMTADRVAGRQRWCTDTKVRLERPRRSDRVDAFAPGRDLASEFPTVDLRGSAVVVVRGGSPAADEGRASGIRETWPGRLHVSTKR